MSMETKFEFDKLNRVPKKSIKLAIEEYQEKNPNKALNRYELCKIISLKLEAKYLRPQTGDASTDTELLEEESQVIKTVLDEDSDELENSKPKKNYNGEHILKKMKLNSTGQILEKIDFYIYRYY